VWAKFGKIGFHLPWSGVCTVRRSRYPQYRAKWHHGFFETDSASARTKHGPEESRQACGSGIFAGKYVKRDLKAEIGQFFQRKNSLYCGVRRRDPQIPHDKFRIKDMSQSWAKKKDRDS
jgi:hypothetical protein